MINFISCGLSNILRRISIIAFVLSMQNIVIAGELSEITENTAYVQVNADSSVYVVEKITLQIAEQSVGKVGGFSTTVPRFRNQGDALYQVNYELINGFVDDNAVNIKAETRANDIKLTVSSTVSSIDTLSKGEHTFTWVYKVHNYVGYAEIFDTLFITRASEKHGFAASTGKIRVALFLPKAVDINSVAVSIGSYPYSVRGKVTGNDYVVSDAKILSGVELSWMHSILKKCDIIIADVFSGIPVADATSINSATALTVEVAFPKGAIARIDVPAYGSVKVEVAKNIALFAMIFTVLSVILPRVSKRKKVIVGLNK